MRLHGIVGVLTVCLAISVGLAGSQAGELRLAQQPGPASPHWDVYFPPRRGATQAMVKALASLYAQNWQDHALHSEPPIGRGVRR
jgi:hypothetical protein